MGNSVGGPTFMHLGEQRETFLQLVTEHQGQIFGYLYALLQNLEDAQDLQQQTLMVMWQKFDSFAPGTNFLAWARQIAQYEVLSFRKRRPQPHGLSDEVLRDIAAAYTDPADLDREMTYRDALAGCLQKLRPDDRNLIELCYEQRCRVKQVAQQLDRSEGSISNSLRRIRQRLYECIQRTLAQEKSA